MIEFSQDQYDALSADAPRRFVERVARLIEEEFPECAGLALGSPDTRRLAAALVDQAHGFNLVQQASILRYVELRLGYFEHAPADYHWAFQLLSDATLTEDEKLLELDDRILGISRWA